ncbi:MAG: CinA family nicotinamide mononucleotide deamidase-related protein [Jiangellales bacterium]
MTGLLSAGGSDAVALLLVGDELLLGSVADTNGAWLARRLTQTGLRVVTSRVVPDDVARIAEGVAALAAEVGSVVVSGGLGPTSDDLTRQALADVSGCPLVPDDAAVAAITGWYADRGRAPDTTVLRMAERPSCAQMLVNPQGSAPGVRLELGSCVVYAVPGVPSELHAMVEAVVLPDLTARAGDLPAQHSVSFEVALLGESAVSALLRDVEALVAHDPSTDLAYLARPAQVSVRLSVREQDAGVAAARHARWSSLVAEALGEHVMGRDGVTLPEVVIAALAAQGASVGAAESLTGGGVTKALTSVPGSSAVLRGGVVAYATDVKQSVLGVGADLLRVHGPVHPDVAVAMARGARALLASTWGVATTGVAGPDPVDDHPAGTVHVAVDGPGGAQVRSLTLAGDRGRVRLLSTAHALDLLRRRLVSVESRGTLDR